jgi:hypothetical protein
MNVDQNCWSGVSYSVGPAPKRNAARNTKKEKGKGMTAAPQSHVRQRLVALLVLMFATVAFTQTTHQKAAYAAWSDCVGSNKVCAWADANGQGARLEIVLNNTCINSASTWNDRISSVWNKWGTMSGHQVTFWHNANCTGTYNFTIGPARTANMSWFDNDEATSWCSGTISNCRFSAPGTDVGPLVKEGT